MGRATDNELVIETTWVSSFHVLIEWRPPGVWELRDLGSRNGTWINGAKIPAGAWHRLALGDRIEFGSHDTELSVVNLDRPLAEAVCVSSGERRYGNDQILTLSEDPHDWVDLIEEQPGVWVIERRGTCDGIADGAEIVVAGQVWRLQLPVVSPPTEPLPSNELATPELVALEFRVSSNLEHIHMFIRHAQREWNTSRAYTRGMLELARVRLADRSELGIHPDERGWIYSDELCTLAGYEDEGRLNVEICRARKELSRFGVPCAAQLIQRRRGTRQLRVATDALRIVELAAH